MNGSRNVLILVLMMSFVLGGTIVLALAIHLFAMTKITSRIDSRLTAIDVWLDSAIQES